VEIRGSNRWLVLSLSWQYRGLPLAAIWLLIQVHVSRPMRRSRWLGISTATGVATAADDERAIEVSSFLGMQTCLRVEEGCEWVYPTGMETYTVSVGSKQDRAEDGSNWVGSQK
jgi:hypothetical protein